MRKQMINHSKLKLVRNWIAGATLAASLVIGALGSFTFAAADDNTGATVVQSKTIDVMRPLTTADLPLADGTKIYIDSSRATVHMQEGDLAINASAYVTAMVEETCKATSMAQFHSWYGNQTMWDAIVGSRRTGYDATYHEYCRIGIAAAGFDECPGGIVYTNDGTNWFYSCSGGGVQALSIVPYIGVPTTSTITVEMVADNYETPSVITRDQIANVHYNYTYGEEVHDGDIPDDKITVIDGEITEDDPEIEIQYGVNRLTIVVPTKQRVTFNPLEGTSDIEDQLVKYGTAATKPEKVPTLAGFEFKYWSLTPGGEEYDFSRPVTTRLTLYAVWEKAATKDVDLIENESGPSSNVSAVGVNNDAVELANQLLTDEEKQLAKTGLDSKVFLTAEDVTDTVDAETKTKIENSLSKGEVLGCVLDLNLFKQIGTNPAVKIANTNGNKVSITIDLKESLINSDDDVNRTFFIIRLHEGEITKIPAIYDAVNNTLTFETDKFSFYSVGFKDTAKPKKAAAATTDTPRKVSSPKTGDRAPIGAVVLVLFASLAGAVVVSKKIR